ncbi:MAG: mechanosensitive ion channel family protein, partial [Hyphomicrobiales bacterium]
MIRWERFLNPDHLRDLATAYLPRVIAAAIVLVAFWIFLRVTQAALRALLRRGKIDETLIHLLVDSVYRLTIWVLGVVTALGQLGINVMAALAGISVAGIALGFAAQDSLANMIAGFLIFWDKPFLVGDFLTVQEQYGRVVEITLRSTRIRTQENTYVIIPNRQVIDSVVVNHTKHGEIRVNVPIGIAYKESIPEARRVLLDAVRGLEGTIDDPAPDVVTVACGDSSVNLYVRVWVDRPELEKPVFYRAMEASKLA